MSVAKMRTASPKRVTMVTSASRISGDGPAATGGSGRRSGDRVGR